MYNYCLKTESSIRLELLKFISNPDINWRLRHFFSPIKVVDIPKQILAKDNVIVHSE